MVLQMNSNDTYTRHFSWDQQRSHGNFCTFSSSCHIFLGVPPNLPKSRAANCNKSNHLAKTSGTSSEHHCPFSCVPPFGTLPSEKPTASAQEILPPLSVWSQWLWYSASWWRAFTYRKAIRKGVNSSWEQKASLRDFWLADQNDVWMNRQHDFRKGNLRLLCLWSMFSCDKLYSSLLTELSCIFIQVRGLKSM